MPEGDTIFRAARALNKALAGKVVTAFETALAPLARVNDDAPLAGRTVERVEARGKWCLMFFSGDLILLTHMRMSGSWHLYKTGERWQAPRNACASSSPAERCRRWDSIFLSPSSTLQSRSSAVQMCRSSASTFSARSTASTRVCRRSTDYRRSHPDAEIANVLLNQRVLAGIGNVYKSEIAFAAHVNPFRKMQTISDRELEPIAENAPRYMKENVV